MGKEGNNEGTHDWEKGFFKKREKGRNKHKQKTERKGTNKQRRKGQKGIKARPSSAEQETTCSRKT